MQDRVDLVLLSRGDGPLPHRVQRGISRQQGVQLQLHRIVGQAEPTDACRWETIARARNCGKQLGSAPWLMFLDDDVVLAPGCVRTLVWELKRRPTWGALAADYLREDRQNSRNHHVAMGATLFRRAALDRIKFRWDSQQCECQCCCDDLRKLGYEITYTRAAIATHSRKSAAHLVRKACAESRLATSAGSPKPSQAQILTAFDFLHFRSFRDQFLTSLRSAGNNELVSVAGYGLFPSQQRELARLSNVELLSLSNRPGVSPSLRRLHDFQTIVARLDDATPVAYWDAGDVIFQSRLTELWAEVRAKPDKLLAVLEPYDRSLKPSMSEWTLSIRDPAARQWAMQQFLTQPCLNGGFAAATAKSMLRYLQSAEQLHSSPALAGTTDWGDQMALNVYCRSNPELWHALDESWNYCLCRRDRSQVRVGQSGRIENNGHAIRVVHGNAKSLDFVPGYRHARHVLAAQRRAVLH